MKANVIFLTNRSYVDTKENEGGASLCTKEYLKLLAQKYNVIPFLVENRKSILYRFEVKMGLNTYRDFNPNSYLSDLIDLIKSSQVGIIFLNQSNTSCFGNKLKTIFGNSLLVVICSHGNESGDLIHDSTRNLKSIPIFRKLILNYNLGRTLRKEVFDRMNFIDAVLTVSETEFQIENWLGAKKVKYIPRTVQKSNIVYDNSKGIVGFIGDLSHPPNFEGIYKVCLEIKNIIEQQHLEIRVVSSNTKLGLKLQDQFPFVRYLGYLTNHELDNECTSWSFFINPVFYFSRGVTTKLAKSLSMGIPVITTPSGNRGYEWSNGELPIANNPKQMSNLILQLSNDKEQIVFYRKQVQDIIESTPKIQELAEDLDSFLANI